MSPGTTPSGSRRYWFKVLVWFLIPSALLTGFFVAMFGQPLLPSRAMTFTYAVDGSTFHDGRVTRPLGMGDAFYLQLPQAPKPLYQWFMIRRSQKQVVVPVAVYQTGWGMAYVHADQKLGVRLSSGKLEDSWKVEWDGNEVRFSNGGLMVEGQFDW